MTQDICFLSCLLSMHKTLGGLETEAEWASTYGAYGVYGVYGVRMGPVRRRATKFYRREETKLGGAAGLQAATSAAGHAYSHFRCRTGGRDRCARSGEQVCLLV